MPLFQTSVLKKYLAELDTAKVQAAYAVFQQHFADPVKQENIRNAKEEQYQEGFLRELFVDALGYTLNPSPDYNLTTEFKNQTDAKKADGAIMTGGAAVGVIELKGTNTTDFKKIEEQAFRYKNNQKGCRYVVTSNFERLRFYIDDATDFEEWDLFNLTPERFAILYLCLAKTNLLAHIPVTIKENSVAQEENVTKKLYADYRDFKRALFADLRARNPETDPLLLYKKTQKLLDRLLFIFFAEDRGLLPPNSIHEVLMQWQELRDKYDEPVSLYGRFRKYFGYMNTGHQGQKHEIFGYNGGLFAPDEILDHLKVGDTVLFNGAMALTRYDFVSEVDVNILGHIFEHSLNEIEEVQAELEGRAVDKGKTKRKKDGVFYTPKYITQYIVENTVGALCRQKQAELGLRDEDYADRVEAKKRRKELHARLEAYRQWLLGITILDPACGSGAFLNQAFNFLIEEHARLDRLQATLFGDALALSDVDLAILENNLYGVDLNEESVEIAQLALWLRTAKKGRKLSALSHNLRRGNSLIDDPAVAGDAAFNWQQAFPEVFEKGGFDVVVGNPPYVPLEFFNENEKQYFRSNFPVLERKYDSSAIFILKGLNLINSTGILSYISSVTWQTGENYKNFRKVLFEKYGLLEIVNLPFDVFADAYVDTCIYFFSNYKTTKYRIFNFDKSDKVFDLSQLEFSTIEIDKIAEPDYKIILTEKAYDLLDQIKQRRDTISLGEISISTQGLAGNRFNISDEEFENSFPFLKNGQGYRYWLKIKEVGFTSLDEYKSLKQFYEAKPKILIRRIISRQDRLLACFTDKRIVFTKDMNPFVIIDKEFKTKFVLSILNSSLISYLYLNFSSIATKDDFRQTTLSELRNLPIVKTTFEEQGRYEAKVDFICKKIIDFESVTTRFLSLLTAKYPSLQPTKKLESWPELTFAEFLKELKKQKIAWSLREESEWLEHFTQEQAAARVLRQEIEKTDREIDRMVYELYGLTEAEIALVEGRG